MAHQIFALLSSVVIAVAMIGGTVSFASQSAQISEACRKLLSARDTQNPLVDGQLGAIEQVASLTAKRALSTPTLNVVLVSISAYRGADGGPVNVVRQLAQKNEVIVAGVAAAQSGRTTSPVLNFTIVGAPPNVQEFLIEMSKQDSFKMVYAGVAVEESKQGRSSKSQLAVAHYVQIDRAHFQHRLEQVFLQARVGEAQQIVLPIRGHIFAVIPAEQLDQYRESGDFRHHTQPAENLTYDEFVEVLGPVQLSQGVLVLTSNGKPTVAILTHNRLKRFQQAQTLATQLLSSAQIAVNPRVIQTIVQCVNCDQAQSAPQSPRAPHQDNRSTPSVAAAPRTVPVAELRQTRLFENLRRPKDPIELNREKPAILVTKNSKPFLLFLSVEILREREIEEIRFIYEQYTRERISEDTLNYLRRYQIELQRNTRHGIIERRLFGSIWYNANPDPVEFMLRTGQPIVITGEPGRQIVMRPDLPDQFVMIPVDSARRRAAGQARRIEAFHRTALRTNGESIETLVKIWTETVQILLEDNTESFVEGYVGALIGSLGSLLSRMNELKEADIRSMSVTATEWLTLSDLVSGIPPELHSLLSTVAHSLQTLELRREQVVIAANESARKLVSDGARPGPDMVYLLPLTNEMRAIYRLIFTKGVIEQIFDNPALKAEILEPLLDTIGSGWIRSAQGNPVSFHSLRPLGRLSLRFQFTSRTNQFAAVVHVTMNDTNIRIDRMDISLNQ